MKPEYNLLSILSNVRIPLSTCSIKTRDTNQPIFDGMKSCMTISNLTLLAQVKVIIDAFCLSKIIFIFLSDMISDVLDMLEKIT